MDIYARFWPLCCEAGKQHLIERGSLLRSDSHYGDARHIQITIFRACCHSFLSHSIDLVAATEPTGVIDWETHVPDRLHIELRRNLITEGIALNHLVGRDFRVGAVSLRGLRLCEPCGHLEKLTMNGVERGLRHRGGLRAQVVSSGTMRVGDDVG